MLRRQLPGLTVAALMPRFAEAYDPLAMIEAQPGTLPLLLTVPHDGGEFLGLFPNRTQGVTVRDAGTRALAHQVAVLLQQRSGRRPFLVVAKFSRKHLDANRPEHEAMESEEALPAYRAYHTQVEAYVAQMRATFPSGALLIDVHGQAGEPNTSFRGTRAGLTATRLLNRFGPSALQGPHSITGLLAARGYRVHPDSDAKTLREDPRYAGGYTVFTYGSHKPAGVDAIQLEFGQQHRANPRLAEDVAASLLGFMTHHGLITP
jgi:N-formylglutamate amidohydrolase